MSIFFSFVTINRISCTQVKNELKHCENYAQGEETRAYMGERMTSIAKLHLKDWAEIQMSDNVKITPGKREKSAIVKTQSRIKLFFILTESQITFRYSSSKWGSFELVIGFQIRPQFMPDI